MIVIGLKLELPWIWHFIKYIPLPGIKASAMGVINRMAEAGTVAVKNTKEAPKGSNKTILSKMFPEDGSEQPFTDDVLAAESCNIIIAGSDTTAMALTYLVFEVLRDPEVKA